MGRARGAYDEGEYKEPAKEVIEVDEDVSEPENVGDAMSGKGKFIFWSFFDSSICYCLFNIWVWKCFEIVLTH